MGLISASDARDIRKLSMTPEKMVEELKIEEKIVKAANEGHHLVYIDYRDNDKMKNIETRIALTEYLSKRGYVIRSTNILRGMTVSWSEYDTGALDGYGSW